MATLFKQELWCYNQSKGKQPKFTRKSSVNIVQKLQELEN